MIIYLKHQMTHRVYAVIATLLLISLGIFAETSFAANQLLLERASFEDVTNQLTYDQVKNQSFEPFDQIMAKGFRHSTFWLKLKVKGGESQPLVLRVNPAFTDEIELFDAVSPRKKHVTGELHPWHDADYKSLSLNFKLEPTAYDRDVFLRVKSSQNYILHPDIFLEDDFRYLEKQTEMGSIAYTSFIFIIFVWLFFTWLVKRELVIGCFTLVQFFAGVHALFTLGLARVYFDGLVDNVTLNTLTNIFNMGYVGITLYAHYFLIAEYDLKRGYKILFQSLIVMPFICFTMLWLNHDTLALQANLAYALFSPLLFISSITKGVKKDGDDILMSEPALPRKVLLIYYSILLVILSIVILPFFGIVRATGFSIHALFVHAFLNGLLIFSLMQYRLTIIQKREMQAMLYERTLVAQEKIRHEEQGKLIGMLTHEVKNSLSVINFSVDAILRKIKGEENQFTQSVSQFQGAIDDISAVIDKCVSVDRVEQGAFHLNLITQDIVPLIKGIIAMRSEDRNYLINLPNEYFVFTDADIFSIIVKNLIENAVKYSEKTSSIEVCLLNDVLTISNFPGHAGYPDAGKIFTKYYRSEKSHRDRGTGLGLWLCKELSERINVRIAYEPDDQKIHFKLYLPQ